MENCTRYDCMETAVGAVILASGVVCPPFNDTECIQVRTSKCPVYLIVMYIHTFINYRIKINNRNPSEGILILLCINLFFLSLVVLNSVSH